MENDVFLLLLGTGEGAYALASLFGGEYGIPVCVMDADVPDAFAASAFVTETRTVSGIAYRGIFLRALSDFYEAHAGKRLLLIPTTEVYTDRVLAEKDELERMFLLPQKKSLKTKKVTFVPHALLLLYVGREGSICTVYGEVAARSETGDALAIITKPTPKELLDKLPNDTPHFALYAVGGDGECLPASEEYFPYLAFPSAADLSLAEWILTDYITCEAVGADGSAPSGLFMLFPYRKIKKHLLPSLQKEAKLLRRKHLSLSLYPARGETGRPLRRARLKRFYRENWEKRTKAKK